MKKSKFGFVEKNINSNSKFSLILHYTQHFFLYGEVSLISEPDDITRFIFQINNFEFCLFAVTMTSVVIVDSKCSVTKIISL